MEQANQDQHEIRGVRRGRPPKVKQDDRAQTLAMRIWAGQCPDLLRPDRVARVAAGLAAQGMSMDGVILPNA